MSHACKPWPWVLKRWTLPLLNIDRVWFHITRNGMPMLFESILVDWPIDSSDRLKIREVFDMTCACALPISQTLNLCKWKADRILPFKTLRKNNVFSRIWFDSVEFALPTVQVHGIRSSRYLVHTCHFPVLSLHPYGGAAKVCEGSNMHRREPHCGAGLEPCGFQSAQCRHSTCTLSSQGPTLWLHLCIL